MNSHVMRRVVSNMLHQLNKILYSAAAAYVLTCSGNNNEYVISKSNRFVDRCINYELDYDQHQGYVSTETVKDICWQALDDDATQILLSELNRIENGLDPAYNELFEHKKLESRV